MELNRRARADSRFSQIGGMVVILAIFGLAAARRFSLPQLPIADSDFGYFLPALNKLAGGDFEPLNGVNFFYPAGVYGVLRLCEDFRAIGLAQHLAGLAAGVAFIGAWRCLGNFLPPTRWNYEVHRWLGIAGLATYLLSNNPLIFESQVRADALCMFAEIFSLWLCLESVCDSVVRRNQRRALVLAVASIFSGVILAALKPSFLAPGAIIIGLATFVTVRHSKGRWITSLALAGAILGSTVTFAVWQTHFSRGNDISKFFLRQTLFTIHARIIHAQMLAEISDDREPASQDPWLRQAASDLGTAIVETHRRFPEKFPRLGFEPDYLLNSWDERQPLLYRWRAELGEDRYGEFLSYWYWHAVRKRPLAFVHKVSQQMGVFYSRDCPAFRSRRWIRFDYPRTIVTFESPPVQALIAEVPAARRFLAQTRDLLQTDPPRWGEAGVVNLLNRLCKWAYLPGLLLSLAACVWLWVGRSFSDQARDGALLVIFLYAVNLGSVLSISIIHSMEIWRYAGVQFLAALLATLWAVSWLSSMAESALRRPRVHASRGR